MPICFSSGRDRREKQRTFLKSGLGDAKHIARSLEVEGFLPPSSWKLIFDEESLRISPLLCHLHPHDVPSLDLFGFLKLRLSGRGGSLSNIIRVFIQ